MAKIVEDALLIYTDGSLYPKGRKGGIGIVFVLVDDTGGETILEEHAPPGVRGTTNNRMELEAAIEALRLVHYLECYPRLRRIVLRTDSSYLANGHLSALRSWPQRKWHTATGTPVENADLWKDLVRQHHKLGCRFEIHWVKGHGRGHLKDPLNERADRLAKQSAAVAPTRRIHLGSVRRKKTGARTKRGSVRIEGQTMTIRIVSVQWLSTQSTWKHRYEVISRDHPDCGSLDFIWCPSLMADGHYFEVRVNDEPAYPQVVEIIREVPRADVEVPKAPAD